MEESGRCWRRAGPVIGSDSDLERSNRLWFTLFGYLNLPSYVASGRRMVNLPGLTTPNEVRLASDVQLGEHGFGLPFRLLEPREKNSLKSSWVQA
jgi:hypothetical protein